MLKFEIYLQQTEADDDELPFEVIIGVRAVPKACRQCTEASRNTAGHVSPTSSEYKTCIFKFETKASADLWLKHAASHGRKDFVNNIVEPDLCCPAHWLSTISEIKLADEDVLVVLESANIYMNFYFSSAAKKKAYMFAHFRSMPVRTAN
jgi:hypothetical protein